MEYNKYNKFVPVFSKIYTRFSAVLISQMSLTLATPISRPNSLHFCFFGVQKKYNVYVNLPSHLRDLDELKNYIIDSFSMITINLLQQVYGNFEYHLDVNHFIVTSNINQIVQLI